MQQTENYKLNLIETSDPFSPNPLNENMVKLDALVSRFTYGTYTGNGKTSGDSQFIELPFTPKLVYVGDSVGRTFYNNGIDQTFGGVALEGVPAHSGSTIVVEIVEGGFQVTRHSSYYTSNHNGKEYLYFAIG